MIIKMVKGEDEVVEVIMDKSIHFEGYARANKRAADQQNSIEAKKPTARISRRR